MTDIEWKERIVDTVVVRYVSAFESDVDRVAGWIRRATALCSNKYGLQCYAPPVRLYLHVAPTPRADRHLTTYGYWAGRPFAEINALTPSAPAWAAGGISLAGLPYDSDDYREKNIVHELIHAVQMSFWGEPRDNAYPKWWLEGLPEYDGLFHTTPINRSAATATLVRRVNSHISGVRLDDATQIAEVLCLDNGYSTGPLFVWFLSEHFGEGLHESLLRSHPTVFEADLLRMTKAGSGPELHGDFLRWLALQ